MEPEGSLPRSRGTYPEPDAPSSHPPAYLTSKLLN